MTNGITYALKIENLYDFLEYGEKWFNDDDDFLNFEAVYNLNIKSTFTNNQNELAFANLIIDSGLKLFKGNPISFDTWTPITINPAQTGIINDNCN